MWGVRGPDYWLLFNRFAHSARPEGRQENHEEQKRKSWMMTKTMLRMMTVVKMRIMRDSHDALFLIVFLWSPRYLPIFSGFRSPGGAPRPSRRLPKGGQNRKTLIFWIMGHNFCKSPLFPCVAFPVFLDFGAPEAPQGVPKASQNGTKIEEK